jgi:hypothetical protein
LLFAAVAVCGMTTALGLRATIAPSSSIASVPSEGP